MFTNHLERTTSVTNAGKTLGNCLYNILAEASQSPHEKRHRYICYMYPSLHRRYAPQQQQQHTSPGQTAKKCRAFHSTRSAETFREIDVQQFCLDASYIAVGMGPLGCFNFSFDSFDFVPSFITYTLVCRACRFQYDDMGIIAFLSTLTTAEQASTGIGYLCRSFVCRRACISPGLNRRGHWLCWMSAGRNNALV